MGFGRIDTRLGLSPRSRLKLFTAVNALSIYFALSAGAAQAQAQPAPIESDAAALTEAATDAQAEASADADETIRDIVVTAQRRDSRLQDTPVAVTALDSELIEKNSIHNIEDIGRITPGLTVPGTALNNNSVVAIRGISFFSGVNSVSYPVAFYIDGLFTDRPFNIRQNLFDVERIEVLRGPQGVLFGRNATAGAVIIQHTLPNQQFRALGRLEVGSWGTRAAQASIRGPLSEEVAVGVAGSFRVSDGYGVNVATGDDIYGEDAKAIRGTIRVTPSSTTEFILRGSYNRERSSYGIKNILGFATLEDAIENDPNLDPYEVNNDFGDSFTDRTLYSISLEGIVNLSGFDVIGQVGYQKSDQFSRADSDGTGLRISENVENNKATELFSTELRLSSNNDSRLKWDVGLFYLFEHPYESDNHVLMYSGGSTVRNGGNDINRHETHGNSYAVFAHAAYDLTSDFTLRAGGRYTIDKKKYNVNVDIFTPTSIRNLENEGQETWKSFTPTFGFDYRFTPDIFGYGTVSKGYKSGGFNFTDAVPFGPENVWSYELGLKTDLFDRKARINLAGFYMDYSDIQVSRNVANGLVFIQNAAKSSIYGLEAEAVVQPVRGLRFDASLAWLNAQYDDFILDDRNPLGTNLEGEPLNYAPKWKAAIAGEYSAPIGDRFTGAVRVSYAYEDSVYFVSLVQPIRSDYKRESIKDLGMRLSFGDIDERWEVALVGRNLTDRKYFSTLQQLLGGANRAAYYGPPRYFGLEVKLSN